MLRWQEAFHGMYMGDNTVKSTKLHRHFAETNGFQTLQPQTNSTPSQVNPNSTQPHPRSTPNQLNPVELNPEKLNPGVEFNPK